MRAATMLSPAAALLIVLSACSPDLITPPVGVRAIDAPAASLRSRATPNKTRYKNAGIKPTKVKAGPVELEGRAVQSMDGTVLLEVTTGSLDDGTSTGQIKKALVGPADGSTDPVPYNSLVNTGYWSTTLTGYAHGTLIAVQATVEPDSSNRPFIVRLETPVVRRPDVKVVEISAPPEAQVDAPVLIAAIVKEINGDIGARGDCLLSVDGVAADVAPGIWVDANDMVTCLFTHTFTSTGAHQLKVTMANVAPGDWDTNNNSALASIMINVPILSNALIVEHHVYTTQVVTTEDGFFPEYHEYNIDNRYSHVNYFGTDVVAFKPMQRATVSIALNGSTVHAASFGEPLLYGVGASQCAMAGVVNEVFRTCSGLTGGAPYTSFQYTYTAGSVTYWGTHIICALILCNETGYFTHNAYPDPMFQDLMAGTVVSVDLKFVDADGVGHLANGGTTLQWVSKDRDYSECHFGLLDLANLCRYEKERGFMLIGSNSW